MRKFTLRGGPDTTGKSISELLSRVSGISRMKVKDAMNKGAVRISGKGKARRIIRRASQTVREGDFVEFFYDEKLLSLMPPEARLLKDEGRYSAWFKPPGLLSQGTEYGDHCSILRQVEKFFNPPRPVFPVHRLDREASGVMIIAHDREAASRLSSALAADSAEKKYLVQVKGDLAALGGRGRIDKPLDGKNALTEYRVLGYDSGGDFTEVEAVIKTGRLHQIRRHFEMIGFPVLGDPRYGSNNKNEAGMKLKAVSLKFKCPFSGREIFLPADSRTG